MFKMITIAALLLSSTAFGEDRGFLTAEREFKGYAKRHRLAIGNSYTLSPSQLHEVYGSRFDLAVDGSDSDTSILNRSAEVQSQTVSARGLIGGDLFTVGIGGQIRGYQASLDNTDVEESFQIFKFNPQLAMTIEDQVSIGFETDFGVINSIEEFGARHIDARGTYIRPTMGISFHTSKLETGIAFTGTANAKLRRTNKLDQESLEGFGLVGQSPDLSAREIYMPAHQTIFARGNLTDNWSIAGNISHVQLDANNGSLPGVFEKYRTSDHLASTAQVSYWTAARSRLSASLNYRGASFAPTGYEENGLNLRMANLYGASVEGIWRADRNVYVGATLISMRGERNQTYKGIEYDAREEGLRIIANLSMDTGSL
jgi:hypothetical protein